MSVTVINKAQDVGLKIILVVLGLIFLVGCVLLYVFEKHHSDCKNNEGPLCLTGNCPAASSNCGNAPFRAVEGTGSSGYQCKSSLMNQQDVPQASLQSGTIPS
jgi:hypothetical protein